MEAMMQLLSPKAEAPRHASTARSSTKAASQSFGTLASHRQKAADPRSSLSKKQSLQSVLQTPRQKQKKASQPATFTRSNSNSSSCTKLESTIQIASPVTKAAEVTKKPSSENSGGNHSGNTTKTAQFVPETSSAAINETPSELRPDTVAKKETQPGSDPKGSSGEQKIKQDVP